MLGRKKAPPKKKVHEKSIMDHIKEAAKKKCKRTARWLCKICHKFNHDIDQYMKNPVNQVNMLEEVLDEVLDWLIDWLIIITLPIRLNVSGQRGKIIIQTKDTSFWSCSISLYLSLPRKLIGLLDLSSPVRLMAATWSLPDCGWWRQWDCFWFCFTPIRRAGPALVSV